MKVTTKILKSATKIEVSDGHPINSDGTWIKVRRPSNLWFEPSEDWEEMTEEGLTDKDQLRCTDVLRAWDAEGNLLLDIHDEMIAKWDREAEWV